MKAYLTRRYRISASHRLHNDGFDAEQNRNTYGKCNNPHGHGHNYAIEVTVSGQIDKTTGMICNLVDLDECVRREVVDRFDHQNLNLLSEFSGLVPTTENLAAVIYDKVAGNFRLAKVEKIRIEETSNNFFEYAGGAEARI